MFQFVQKHQKLIQIIMTILFIPFVFAGVNGVINDGVGRDVVAKVGSHEITQQMFDAEFQNYKNDLRRNLGDKVDDALLDSFAFRQAFLNQMIDRAVLKEASDDEHLSASDSMVAQALSRDPQIPKDAQGNIDFTQYEALVKRTGMTMSQFENNLRAQLAATTLTQTASFGTEVLPLQSDYLKKLLSKVQMVEQKNISPAPFFATVTVTPEQIQQYYQTHTADFDRPATFDLEYVVIPVLPANYTLTDDDIKRAFGVSGATSEELAGVRKDPIKLKEAMQKVATIRMESVAKSIIEASAVAPKDLSAIVAKFGGRLEVAQGVTRRGNENLPVPLKSVEVREALTSSEMAASNAIGEPVAYETNLVVGRVAKSSAAGVQLLETVKAEIETKLKQQSVLAKVREQADKEIAAMNPNASIGMAIPMGRLLKRSVGASTLGQVMAVKEYPKLLVGEGDAGVSILRVVGSVEMGQAGQAELSQEVSGWRGLAIELQRRAFLQALRERYDVKVFTKNLGGRDNPSSKVKA